MIWTLFVIGAFMAVLAAMFALANSLTPLDDIIAPLVASALGCALMVVAVVINAGLV